MFSATIKSQENEDISILVRVDNHSFNYLCECGDASDLTVKDCQDIQAIFISHTHIDHFVNFDFVLRHQLGIKRRVVICGPTGISAQVQSRIRSYQWNLIEEDSISYEVREILPEGKILVSEIKPPKWEIVSLPPIENGIVYENEKFQVRHTILDHKTDSIAYLFKEADTVNIQLKDSGFRGGKWIKELKDAFAVNDLYRSIFIEDSQYEARDLIHLLSVKTGDSLGIIMDHAANEANHQKIRELFSDCRKVLIEAFYKESDREFADANFHSYSVQSAKIMRECKVQEAVPVHFSRKYQAEEIEELREEFLNGLNRA